MSTAEAPMVRSESTLQTRIEGLVFDVVKLAAGLLGAGAILFYAWNWALAPAIINLRPLSGFWMGPLLAGGLYLAWMAWRAIRDDSISVDLDNLDGVIDLVAMPACVLALMWAVHTYLL